MRSIAALGPEVAEVPLIAVSNARRALAETCAWWEGDPAEELAVIGVTGTDGKTTTSTYLSTALSAAGLSSGLISTALQRVGGREEPMAAHQTTPEAPALQAQLRKIAAAGDRAAVLETTSHGLALDRVAAINYAAGIVTNFTSDHLDLHGTVEEYRKAKLLLVDRVRGSVASKAAQLEPLMVIRRADPSLARFAAAAEAAGIRVVDFDVAEDGALLLDGERHEVTLRMPGRINALNAAAALALVAAWKLPLDAAIAAVSAEPGPPGRSQAVDAGQPFKVIVDFAHTGPSLTAAIGVARSLLGPGGRLLLVTGAAGSEILVGAAQWGGRRRPPSGSGSPMRIHAAKIKTSLPLQSVTPQVNSLARRRASGSRCCMTDERRSPPRSVPQLQETWCSSPVRGMSGRSSGAESMRRGTRWRRRVRRSPPSVILKGHERRTAASRLRRRSGPAFSGSGR